MRAGVQRQKSFGEDGVLIDTMITHNHFHNPLSGDPKATDGPAQESTSRGIGRCLSLSQATIMIESGARLRGHGSDDDMENAPGYMRVPKAGHYSARRKENVPVY